jgi:hypothetical protein
MYRPQIVKLTSRARFSAVRLHAGREPDPSTGALITPTCQMPARPVVWLTDLRHPAWTRDRI